MVVFGCEVEVFWVFRGRGYRVVLRKWAMSDGVMVRSLLIPTSWVWLGDRKIEGIGGYVQSVSEIGFLCSCCGKGFSADKETKN